MLEKYDVVAIVVILSNNIWYLNAVFYQCWFQPDILFMFFHAHVDYSSGFIDIYFSERAKYFMELSGDFWFLGFLKRIFSIFLEGLKIVQILNSICSKFLNSPIRFVVFFTYRKIERLLLFNFSCDCCVSELFFVPLLCLLMFVVHFFLIVSDLL